MPHDKHGQLLTEGDEVILRCKIINVSPGVETACNVTAEPIERPDGEAYVPQIAGNSKFYEKYVQPVFYPEEDAEEVRISAIPDFKAACNCLRADILSLDKEVEALVGHESLSLKLTNEQRGEVIANLKLAHRHLEDARMRLGKAIQHSESRESIFDIQKDAEKLAGHLYTVYCKSVGGKAFNGDPLPEWAEFSTDPNKTKQADAWRATAKAAIPPQQ